MLQRFADTIQVAEPENWLDNLLVINTYTDYFLPKAACVVDLIQNEKMKKAKPAIDLGVDVLPPLAQLIRLFFVPVEVKVALVVRFKHAVTDESRLLQLILHVVEYLLSFINLCPPVLCAEAGMFNK